MNFNKVLKITIFKAEKAFNSDGKQFLKCNFRYTSQQFSEKKNKEYKLTEVVWGAELYGSNEELDGFLAKMLEIEIAVNENKKLPKEEKKKKVPLTPKINIYIYDYDINSYYFTATKKSLYKFVIKGWSYLKPLIGDDTKELQNKVDDLNNKIEGLKEKIDNLKEENRALKKKLVKKDLSYDSINEQKNDEIDEQEDEYEAEDEDFNGFDYKKNILF